MEMLTNRILLIDDNPDNLELLSDLIQHAFPGHTSLIANSGVKGLALAASEDPDVILLDVVMPGMNGFEVCQKLKSDPKTSLIPVVFITAIKGDREARLQAIEVGADAFLSRPVDESELKAQIRAMQKIKSAAALQQDEKENLTSLVALQTQALQETHSATLNLLDDLHAENEARKKNEAALRDSEDKFRYLFDYSVAPKSVTQLSGVMQVNQAFCDMLGYTRAELENKTWQELTHPDDVEMNQKAIDLLLGGKKVSIRLTKRYLHKNGSIVWVDFGSALRRDNDGKPLYLISSFNDITERKQAEEALRASEQRFRTLIESAPMGIYMSRDGIGLYANQKDLKMFGLTRMEEVIGRPVTDLLAPQSIEASQNLTQRRALDQLTPKEIELVGLRPDGSQFPAHVIVDWVQLPDGPANLAFISDISERKQAQALQEAVYQIAAAAETSLSLNEFYPKIHQSISSVMPAENFYIALYDETKKMLRFPYYRDIVDMPFATDIAPGQGLTAYVLRTGKSLLETSEKRQELERLGEVVIQGTPCAIWLGVPLIVEGKTIGAMAVQHYSDPQAYGERELHILEFVSTQVAIAISRKQAEEAMRASEVRYRGLFEHSPVALWEEDFSAVKLHIDKIRQSGVTDFRAYFAGHPQALLECIGEIKVLDVNAAALTLMHASDKSQLIGSLQRDFPDEGRDGFVNEFANIAEGQTEFAWESQNFAMDGERLMISLRWSVAPGFEDSLEKVLLSVMDITARKQAEVAMRESESRYRGLFVHSPVSLWEEDFSEVKHHIEKIRQSGVTDFHAFFESHPDEFFACVHEIKVLDVNEATLALMHAASKEQLIGNLNQVIRIKPDLDFMEELINIAEGKTEFSWDGINYTLDGEKLFVSLHWSAAPGFEGSLENVLVSIMDVTERKQSEDQIRQLNANLEQRVAERTRQLSEAQEQLVRHEKLATLGQLAGGVGHELRNPLGVINSAVYYLKLVQPDADEKIKKYHTIIEQEVSTASRIINDLLDFGRIVNPDRQPVSIPDLIKHMLTRFPIPSSVHLQLSLPASLPKVFVDPIHLEQVLGNLTTNACQAMRDCKDGGSLVISASQKKDQVVLAVKDNGTGITPEAMQRLFEPLFTTKLRGIGLGLAVSKKLAEANGGSITVRSQPGKGATFTVFLPVKA